MTHKTVPMPEHPTQEMYQAFLNALECPPPHEGFAAFQMLWYALTDAAPTSELAELERELAEESARHWFENVLVEDDGWYNSASGFQTKADRYLELRGLLERHPDNPDSVRIIEPPKVQQT